MLIPPFRRVEQVGILQPSEDARERSTSHLGPHVAECLDRPKHIFALAQCNKESWEIIRALLYRKDVVLELDRIDVDNRAPRIPLGHAALLWGIMRFNDVVVKRAVEAAMVVDPFFLRTSLPIFSDLAFKSRRHLIDFWCPALEFAALTFNRRAFDTLCEHGAANSGLLGVILHRSIDLIVHGCDVQDLTDMIAHLVIRHGTDLQNGLDRRLEDEYCAETGEFSCQYGS
jgi:hypothetical protein